MISSLTDKFDKLRELLAVPLDQPPVPAERGILLIYPPDQELDFRQHLTNFVQMLVAQSIPHALLSVEALPFQCLDDVALLGDAFRLEAEDPKGLRQYLAEELPNRLRDEVEKTAKQLPVGGTIIIASAPALFPWVKYADFLLALPSGFSCRILIPFPGHEQGAYLHFLNHRDGFNYLARRIN